MRKLLETYVGSTAPKKSVLVGDSVLVYEERLVPNEFVPGTFESKIFLNLIDRMNYKLYYI